MIWTVERREVVDGFSESREKRDGGLVLDLEYKGERERERGFLEKLINEFFISLYYFNVKYH